MNWDKLSSQYLIQNKWITVRQDKVMLPSGKIIDDFYVLEYPDWINIIAIDKTGYFIIEQQYRHGIGQTVLEICAGVVESDESPLAAAKRELLEETGYGKGDWQLFMISSPNTNSMTNHCYTFLATDVEKINSPITEDTEDIKVLLFPKEQVKKLIGQNKIFEGVMVAPLWKYFAMN